jgi:hypothetical protein
LRLEELKPSEKTVLNTVKEQQMVHVLAFLCPIPDVKEYNMYGDEDLFLHEAFRTSFFKFHYNRKIVHYRF